MSIGKAFSIIEKNKRLARFFGPASQRSIQDAESILDITFPKSYVLFLQKYGVGNIAGSEFYGIVENPATDEGGIPDAIWLTRDLRETAGLSHEFVAVSETGYGPYYVLDTSHMDADGECPVYMWDVGNQKERIANSFGDFLYEELSNNEELE